MTADFESELDALLAANDEKRKADDQAQVTAKRDAIDFVQSCTRVVTNVIRPTLDRVREKFEERGRLCTIEQDRNVPDDCEEQCASIAIYFDKSEHMPSWRWSGRVIFSCNEQDKVLEVDGGMNDLSDGKPSWRAEGKTPKRLELEDVTEQTIQSEVMQVLRKIYGKS
jgi:hypothetical protein